MKGMGSRDGKIFGNRPMVDRWDETHGSGKRQRPQEEDGESGGRHDPSGHDEIKNVVNEHGAAQTHTIHKTNQGYESITHHEDGHVHHATHDTLGEAQ